MGILHATGRQPFHNALPYDDEPTAERPAQGDFITSGKTKDGQRYEKVVKRKSTALYFEANGELIDPPIDNRPAKRRRSTSPEPPLEDSPNLRNAVYMEVGLPPPVEGEGEWERVEEEEDEEEMVDETPERPPPTRAMVVNKAGHVRKKPRPKLRPIPDASRPKHFQYSPINPSPLRMVSAFDSPKQAPVEIPETIPPETTSPEKGAPIKDEEAYKFSTFVYRLGSIGPMRTSKEMMTANDRAWKCDPYDLPVYVLGSGKCRVRYGRGLKCRKPKALRMHMKENPVEEDLRKILEHITGKPTKFPTKHSTTSSNPGALAKTLQEELVKKVLRPSKPLTQVRHPSGRIVPKAVNTTKLTNSAKPTSNTKVTNGTERGDGTKPTDSSGIVADGKPPTGIKTVNGVPKPTETGIQGPPVNSLAVMVPDINLKNRLLKRNSAMLTPSPRPLIHSLPKATNPMADDIPPLRLPALPVSVPEVDPAPPPRPRLREGPSAAMRSMDWAGAGIRPTPTDATSPRSDWMFLPPITNAAGIWSCNSCMIGNDPETWLCHCCGEPRNSMVPISKWAPSKLIIPRAIIA